MNHEPTRTRLALAPLLLLGITLAGCVHPGMRSTSSDDVQSAAEEDLLALALETVGSLRQEVNSLLPARAHMAEEITRLQATVDEQHRLILSLNEKRGDLLEKFARMELANQTLEEDIATSNEEFTRKLAELSEFQVSGQRGGDAARTFQSLREQNAWLKRKLEELRYRIVREQSDVESLREDLAQIAVGPDAAMADTGNGATEFEAESLLPAPVVRPVTSPSEVRRSERGVADSWLLITIVICLSLVICFALWSRGTNQRPTVSVPLPLPAYDHVGDPVPSSARSTHAPTWAPPAAGELTTSEAGDVTTVETQASDDASSMAGPSEISQRSATAVISTPREGNHTTSSRSRDHKTVTGPAEELLSAVSERTQPLPSLALTSLSPNLTQPIDVELDIDEGPGAARAGTSTISDDHLAIQDTVPIPTLPDEQNTAFEQPHEDAGIEADATESIGVATESIGTEVISAAARECEVEADADTQLIRSSPQSEGKSPLSSDEQSSSDAVSERDSNEKLAEELKGIIHQMLEESL